MKKNFTSILSICIMLFVAKSGSAQAPIFTDAYATGVTFAAFGGSVNAITIDSSVFQSGISSLKIAVPAAGYTGGAFVAATPQNLSAYNAVTFWVKASAAQVLDVAGLGNNSATTVHSAEVAKIAMTTTWTKVIIPIPVPAKLSAETGLFHFAQGSQNGAYTIWIDNIQYENLATGIIGTPTAAMATETQAKSVGDPFNADGLTCSFPVNGTPVVITPAQAYFTFTSSDTTIASVSALGVGKAVGVGTATITAKLGTVAVSGVLTVKVSAATVPTTAPATPPARTAANVISLSTGVYANHPIDHWNASWASATEADVKIAGDSMRLFTNTVFTGTEFTGANLVNAANMGFFHIDVWTPNTTTLKIKLVDFGANGIYDGGGDDSESELTYTPALSQWVSYDIPFSSFVGLTARQHLAQLILSGTTSTIYVDNVYFYTTKVTGTNDLTFSKDIFTAYPTLADDYVAIHMNDNIKGTAQVTLSNIVGQNVYLNSFAADGNARSSAIPTKNLPAGLYILAVRVGNTMQTQKITVAH